MKHLLFSFFITLISISWGQDNIETEIQIQNVFELSIIDIYPEKYPEVSVVFQAKNQEGKPLWLLEKSEINITENGDACDVLKLINITSNKPLNIALVFDHSGSMVDNPDQMPDGMESMQDYYFEWGVVPSGYTMPIEYAKNGVYSFIEDGQSSEDSVMFVGFSSEVDEISPLTNNLRKIKPYIDAATPSGRTAFYDAIFESIDQLKGRESQPVVVAITDGQDNESKHTYKEVIEHAKKHNVPIYIIGLGNVEDYYLEEITSSTDGFFYHTNDPNQLEAIYKNIKEQLRSIYQVDYLSKSDDFENGERTLKFSFVNDTLTFSNSSVKFSLPDEAIAYLEKKEQERADEIERQAQRIAAQEQDAFNQNLLLGGIGGGILLLGIGSFIYFRRRKVKMKIETLFPNPFREKVTVKYNVSETIADPQLTILDLRGNVMSQQSISNANTEIEIDSSNFTRGVYIFKISGDGKTSIGIKGVRQ